MYPVQEVAQHLIRLAAEDLEGEPMNPIRLHKLLYYCQGWYLAWYGKPLFLERLEAWKDGPVVPVVYHLPWGKGRDAISPIPEGQSAIILSAEVKRAIEQVWSYYRKFSAWGLRDKTHDEAPWKNHYHPDSEKRCSEEIPREDLSEYFGSRYQEWTGDAPGTAALPKEDFLAGRTTGLEQLRQELGL